MRAVCYLGMLRMNIIILGAGQVGGTLAESLAKEDNDITLVDVNKDQLADLQLHLDIRTVVGQASYPQVLRQAGAEDADMLIAVTNSDETNLVACQIGAKFFNIPKKIARIRARNYTEFQDELFTTDGFAVDFCISPEQLVTHHVARLIEYPGALQVVDFADGLVRLVAIRPYFGGPLVGKSLQNLKEYMPGYKARVAAIYRKNRSIPLKSDTVIEIGDEVFFVAASDHIQEMMAALRRLDSPNKRIIIAGGGNIGLRLAQVIEHDYQVKLIDHNGSRTQRIADVLSQTTVLLGDAADRELLLNENIEYTDVFCALTNDDEVNIMSAMQAKRMGARQVMALISRTTYVDLLEGGEIDIAISPQYATIGSILTHIRRGDTVNVHSLRRGAAEAIELVAHGDEETSQVVGRKIDQLKLPEAVNVGAIVRKSEVIIPHQDTVIGAGDHIILFLTDKKYIRDVEKLFQVSVTFV